MSSHPRHARLAALLAGILVFGPAPAWPWGGAIHRVINRNAMSNLPPDFQGFAQWSDQIEVLATAADDRKDSTPGEDIKHYINIDAFAEFKAGTFPHSYDQAVAKYGLTRIQNEGTGPWALESAYHDLVTAFRAQDWPTVVTVAADMGHYTGDLHQPLHITENYDGQMTGQSGVHSRFESRLTSRHLPEFTPLPGAAARVDSPIERIFEWIGTTYPGVAGIMAADKGAKSQAGGSTSSEAYYTAFWEGVGQDTWYWVASASKDLAGLWYSAWLEAGSPALPGTTPVVITTWSRIKVLAGS